MANQTAIEQAILELINRARLDPAGEAALDSIDLNEGLPAGTITTQSKQPLAMNDQLLAAAIGHSQSMLTNQYFDHVDPMSGTDPFQRMAAAGYSISFAGENIAVRGTSGAVTTALELMLHQDLFIDSTEPGRGHRTNIEDPNFQEIGVGEANGPFTFGPGQTFNSAMLTEDFATEGTAQQQVIVTQFLTGVAFNDTVTVDKFYTVGEGRNSISIAVTGGPTTTSGNTGAGGYSEQVAAGTRQVTFSGGDEVTPAVLVALIAPGTNAKIDLMGQSTIRTSVTVAEVSGISAIIGLGTIGLTLTGGSGSQSISGAVGNDTINGGAGDDTAVFSGAKANYNIQTIGAVTIVTDTVGRDGSDTVFNTEHLKFADQTVNLNTASLHPTSNFDGHAYDDVLLQVSSNSQLVFANMELGTATGFGALTSPVAGVTVVGHGDINGDGIADVVVQIPTTEMVLVAGQTGTGNGSPNWVALSSSLKGGGADFHAVGIGDINGDGFADVLIQNEGATGDGSILAITAGTFISVAPALKGGGVDLAVVGVGDVNGDGFADIVLQDQANASGQVLVRDVHDNSFVTLATNTGGLKVVGVGDITGDGRADVVLQAAGGGAVVYLDPTAGLNGFQSVIAAANTGLIVKGVADVDGDGRAEILLQSSVTHEVDYFHLTSPGNGTFGAVVGANADVFHLV